jgi:hypothetical protein
LKKKSVYAIHSNRMNKFLRVVMIGGCLFFSRSTFAQQSRLDALFSGSDTTAVIDSLMQGFDAYLDSLSRSKSFFNVSIGAGTGFFSPKNTKSFEFNVEKKIIVSPEVNYFHKSGLGISLNGYFKNESGKFQAYQYAISPSYHYLNRKNFSTGISYTRFFTKENLSFYTTPIENEMYAFFNVKKWWLEPGIAASYGWGSKTQYAQQEIEIFRKRLQATKTKIIYIQQDESVRDFSTLLSLRHNFEWFRVFSSTDLLTLTPVFLLSAGTQNFGLNTTFASNSNYVTNNFLPSNQNITNSRKMDFQSASFLLQVEYTRKRFYLIPQLLLDYYLHQSDKRYNNAYSITAGYHFALKNP